MHSLLPRKNDRRMNQCVFACAYFFSIRLKTFSFFACYSLMHQSLIIKSVIYAIRSLLSLSITNYVLHSFASTIIHDKENHCESYLLNAIHTCRNQVPLFVHICVCSCCAKSHIIYVCVAHNEYNNT